MAPATPRNRGLVIHALVFGLVSAGLLARFGSLPPLLLVWALGLGLHALVGRSGFHAQAPETGVPGAAASEALIEQVHEALSALEAAWPELERTAFTPDFDALYASAEALHAGQRELEEICARSRSLPEQRRMLREQVRDAVSADEVTALEGELQALDGRLAAHQDADAMRRRLASELRTLLHRLEGLRLEVAQRELGAWELDRRTQELQAQVEASREVEAHLAKARRTLG